MLRDNNARYLKNHCDIAIVLVNSNLYRYQCASTFDYCSHIHAYYCSAFRAVIIRIPHFCDDNELNELKKTRSFFFRFAKFNDRSNHILPLNGNQSNRWRPLSVRVVVAPLPLRIILFANSMPYRTFTRAGFPFVYVLTRSRPSARSPQRATCSRSSLSQSCESMSDSRLLATRASIRTSVSEIGISSSNSRG